MHHEPFLYDLVRAHERDLRSAAAQHRLARSVRPDRPTFVDRLRAVGTLGWLIRGARPTAAVRGRSRGEPTAVPDSPPRPAGMPDAARPAECCC